MLGTTELLQILKERGVSQAKIAKALGVAPPRISEMYKGDRRLLLDEAKKLVEAFGIDDRGDISPVSEPVARLLALHAARKLSVRLAPDDPLVADLARDLRVFSEFAADPQVRGNEDAVAGFFRALELQAG